MAKLTDQADKVILEKMIVAQKKQNEENSFNSRSELQEWNNEWKNFNEITPVKELVQFYNSLN